MKSLKIIIPFLILLSVIITANTVFADVAPVTATPQTVSLENPLGEGAGLCTIFKRIAGFMIWAAAPIVAGVIFYGAYQIMFSKGDPKAVTTGKDTILYSVIAYVIILLGWGVTSIIQEILGSKVPIC